jgi:hypothetical protein
LDQQAAARTPKYSTMELNEKNPTPDSKYGKKCSLSSHSLRTVIFEKRDVGGKKWKQ